MNLDSINKEQKRHIEIHKWIMSEKAGHDLSEEACLDWVDHYASAFRDWIKSIPDKCIECGNCLQCGKNPLECPDPFNHKRLDKLGISTKIDPR
jgi:hypothetical protein